RRQRRQPARRPGDGCARDHPLPAGAQLHQAAVRTRLRRRPDRRRGRAGAGGDARGRRLQGLHPGARGGARVSEKTETQVVAEIGQDYKYGFSDPENYVFKSERGLTKEVVEAISSHKSEPDWMRKFRLQSLDYFERRPLPRWGGDVSEIDF